MADRVVLLQRIRFVTAIFCLAMVLLTFAWTRLARAAPLPVYWTIPTFSLQDQRGLAYASQDMAGKVVVANLIYTNCPDVCPSVLEPKMQQLQASARADGILGTRLALISLTADPRRDTPPVLAAFAAHFEADPTAWHFLTGDTELVEQLIHDGFKLDVMPGADPDQIVHDEHFLLIDQRMRVRATYGGLDMVPVQVMHDAHRLLGDRR